MWDSYNDIFYRDVRVDEPDISSLYVIDTQDVYTQVPQKDAEDNFIYEEDGTIKTIDVTTTVPIVTDTPNMILEEFNMSLTTQRLPKKKQNC